MMKPSIIARALRKIDRELQLSVIKETGASLRNLALSESDLAKRQDEMLRRIVKHAYETVPYYRELFDSASLKPSDISGTKDLYKIPVTSKHDLQNADCISSSFDRSQLLETTTGGSTGIPLHIFMEKKTAARRVAEGRRILYLHGYKAFYKKLILAFHTYTPDFINKLGFYRQEAVPWDADLKEQTDRIASYKPDVIEGYPSRLGLLADHILLNEISLPKPKFIVTNSEMLYPEVRDKIERAFGCEVVNVYDSEEFGQVAWECTRHNLHVNADTRIIEILDNGNPAGQGTPGEVVCTDLINYAMPLIRYKIGDIASWSAKKCECGIAYPVLSGITGRASEYLVMPSGKRISSTVVYIPPSIPGIVQYQIVQTAPACLDVKIVRAKDFTEETARKIKEHLTGSTGIRDVRLHYVSSIRKTKRAKFRRFIPLSNHGPGKER
ncbi:phenylacetate--CoA ligase family protein [Candidatus Woesearchaeota archaeon]|nr:MAG: phenylacetate--CoA ligase family protein [Candidatus Woesearchaeota archaeon]